MPAFVTLKRRNESDVDQGPIHINPDTVVAVMGDDEDTVVQVAVSTGVVYRVLQVDPEEPDAPPVVQRLGGSASPPPSASTGASSAHRLRGER
jgi:hypothetical protein